MHTSDGDVVSWQNNQLEFDYNGNSYKVVIDQPMVTHASFYVNGSLKVSAQISRQNGTISGVQLRPSPLASDWFQTNAEGDVTNTSVGPLTPGCSYGDPDCEMPEFTAFSLMSGPCDSFKYAFQGAAAAAVAGAGLAFGAGLIGGLFPPAAPVAGSVAVTAADITIRSGVTALGAFFAWKACTAGGNSCPPNDPNCVEQPEFNSATISFVSGIGACAA